ncbi:MAG: beta-galactosidase [Verrucomicrobia bacterium]|nr:beta-galactosidase [Verrucomicrobiota bacterium]MCH8514397.1 beta-galactosidase [Kiritimatiellia bacterium]
MKNEKWWQNYPWRMIQTNLREIDMADIDADAYVRELKAFHATVAMINVGGIIASYPTKLADQFQSPFLTGDSLQKIISACHAEGIKVIARNDFSKIRRPIYEKHPEWAYRTRAGDIVDYNGDVHACLNGGYQQGYVKKIVREILETLDVDGMFFNMGGFQVSDYSHRHYGPCACEACQTRFREATGFELPASTDGKDPLVRAYELAKRSWETQWREEVHQLIQEIRPSVAMDKFEFFRQESNTEIDRPLPRWMYSAGSNTRWVRTSRPESVSSNTSVDFLGFYYRHVAVNPALQEIRLWQNLANGGGLDYYLIGRLDTHRDRSGFERVKKVFAHHHQNEASYRGMVSEATTLLVRDKGGGLHAEAKGWVRVLIEGHFPFDEILVEALTDVPLDKYRCIILPEVKYLSPAQAEVLDRFCENGGSLLATGQTGFYDDSLARRETPALNAMGIEAVRSTRSDMRSALFEVDRPELYPTLTETELLAFGDFLVFADYAEGVQKHLKLIPPHMFGPPERCYYQQITDLPGFTVHAHGKGKAVYLPWLPGAFFIREGYDNTSRFMIDLLSEFAGAMRLQTSAGPMLEISLHRNEKGARLLSLVNHSGCFGNSFYDPVPMYGQSIDLPLESRASRLPSDLKKPAGVVSLMDGRKIPFHCDEGKLSLRVDVVGMFECLEMI